MLNFVILKLLGMETSRESYSSLEQNEYLDIWEDIFQLITELVVGENCIIRQKEQGKKAYKVLKISKIKNDSKKIRKKN